MLQRVGQLRQTHLCLQSNTHVCSTLTLGVGLSCHGMAVLHRHLAVLLQATLPNQLHAQLTELNGLKGSVGRRCIVMGLISSQVGGSGGGGQGFVCKTQALQALHTPTQQQSMGVWVGWWWPGWLAKD